MKIRDLYISQNGWEGTWGRQFSHGTSWNIWASALLNLCQGLWGTHLTESSRALGYGQNQPPPLPMPAKISKPVRDSTEFLEGGFAAVGQRGRLGLA